MKSKKVILAIVLVLILVGIVVWMLAKPGAKVEITQYEAGTTDIIRKFSVESQDDIKKVESFIKNIKLLEDHEQVNLALPIEIEITYEEAKLSLSLDNQYYCYYDNPKDDIKDLVKMPDGLYDWVQEKLK